MLYEMTQLFVEMNQVSSFLNAIILIGDVFNM